ncbi:MAG: N-acetyltransferase [Sphingomonadales bacterium]
MMIRPEIAIDAEAIDVVTEAAFGQRDEADLISALRISGDIELSLVAEEAGGVAGHVLFTRLASPEDCLALGPVSVLPAWQGHGVGSRLIREGLKRLGEGDWRGVFLLGEPDYYARFGFSLDAAEGFETPYPTDYFMALELQPRGLEKRSPVVYAGPFKALG